MPQEIARKGQLCASRVERKCLTNRCDSRPTATSSTPSEGASTSSAWQVSKLGGSSDLDLSDLSVGYASPSTQLALEAMKPSPNFHLIERFTPDSNLGFADWPSEYDFSAIQPLECHDYLSTASTNMDNYTPIMDVSPHENPPGLNEVCTCNPLCRSPFPWVATWCMQALDESTRSTIILSEALCVPPLEIVRSLFESYFVHLNTSTPCISEWDTYRLLHENPSEGREHPKLMSLALLNTIIYAASGVSHLPRILGPLTAKQSLVRNNSASTSGRFCEHSADANYILCACQGE